MPFAPNPIDVFEFVQPIVAPGGVLANVTAAMFAESQTVLLDTLLTTGEGSAVIVKVVADPWQPFSIAGPQTIIALRADEPGFIAVNAGTVPDPLAARPIEVFEFVQLMAAPAGVLVKLTATVATPLHTVKLETGLITGVGSTETVNEDAEPAHVFSVGVTSTTPLVAADPLFVAVKEGKLPVPFAARPIEALEFAHAYVAPGGVLVKLTAPEVAPLHTVKLLTGVTTGSGSIVMVKVVATPTQPFAVGATVTVPLTAEVVPFVPVNEAIFPVPFAASPIAVLELIQPKVAPAGVLVKLMAFTVAPSHTVTLLTGLATGAGSTVMLNVVAVPTQVFNVGVTVIVPVMEALPELVAVNDPIFPPPLAPSPIAVFELVQPKFEPEGVLVKLTGPTVAPLHTVMSVTGVTVGKGLTVTVKVPGVPMHPARVGVMLTTLLITALVPFVAVKVAMLPVPLAASPVVVFEFVHA